MGKVETRDGLASVNYVPLTPTAFLTRAAQVHPERVAVRYGELSYSYETLDQRCRRLASALGQRGIGRGHVVSIIAPNVPAHLEAHFGVPMAGAILHSINVRLDADTIAYMLDHAGAQLLLADDEYLDLARSAASKLGRPLPIVRIADGQMACPPGDEVEYEELVASGDAGFKPLAPDDEWDTISLNYTSGTTGEPKGVLYHHRGAYLNAVANVMSWGLSGHPIYLWTLPLFHCNGWCFPWTISALAGTHVCLRKVDADAIAVALTEEGITHFSGAPVVLARAIEPPAALRARIPRGVRVMIAGAPPAAAVISAAEEMGFDVTQTYGLTEVYGPCVVSEWKSQWDSRPADERARLKARQGVRYHLQEAVDVLDPETLEQVPSDGLTIGEVMIRGNITMKGYLADPQATAEAFAGGWFHTGDLAVRHPDGYLEIRDRSKDIIISGGENISTIEIENVLYQHPSVAEASVVARKDVTWGEVPYAFVVLKDGEGVTEDDLITFCRGRLARFKAPRAIQFMEIPKTATGKVQKFMLRAIANGA